MGLLGTGTGGKGGQKSETSKHAPTQKTEAAVDRHQNNKMLRQCPSGIAQRPPHHAIAVPAAMQNSHNVRSSAVRKQLKQKKSNSLSIAQLHLPVLDLFWVNFLLGVQLTSFLLISPGLCGVPSAHVLTLQIIRAIKLPPNPKKRKNDRQKREPVWLSGKAVRLVSGRN